MHIYLLYLYLQFQVVQRFQELFAQTKYKEAAELAAESPQGILRTPDTVAKFQARVIDSLYGLIMSALFFLQTCASSSYVMFHILL